MRIRKTLKEWQFSKNTIDYEIVTLPHTWNAMDGQDGGNDYYRGTCTYRTILREEAKKDSEVWLEVTGAAMSADVVVNGKKLYRHEGGYSTFRVNLTEELSGEDVLELLVDNSENDRVYPQKADFTFYGGLYREVNLVIVPKSHFALGYCGGNGVKITPKIAPDYKTAEVEVIAYTEQADGHSVTARIPGVGEQSGLIEDGKAIFVFEIANVKLWNGTENPYLYELELSLDSGDNIVTRFGCRTIEFSAEKGFLLNGKVYPLRGVSRHQDREGLGNAISINEHKEDMALIQEIGANTIRLAHYQHAQEFYDLCDETGMIVWAEIPYITQHMPQGRENTLSQMQELVEQNYNHPSIVCWGLSNEITASPVEDKADLLENHRLLNDLCHSLDATRPTVMANVFMLEIEDEILTIPDINSYNLYFGWYLGDLEQNDTFFDKYHAKYPDRVIGFSEYGADANPKFQSDTPEKGDYSETYQCVYHEHILKMIEERPYLWATHVWNMFDFAADGRDEGGKKGVNQKGLVTFDRKTKKDAFYLYKAYWNQKKPFVHICGSRYEERCGETTKIKVYTNQNEVTLCVDDVAQIQVGKCVFDFEIPLSGTHTVTAVAGDCTESITIRKVEKPNESYSLGRTGDVANWFDEDTFKPDYYSIKDTMGALKSHPGCAAILDRMMAKLTASRGDVAKSANENEGLQRMMAGMSLESLLKQAGGAIPAEQVKQLNAAFQQFKKTDV